MKSLILKDLYNIGHYAKSMLFILLVLAAAFFPTSGFAGYICTCGILSSMMIVTTFSFDDHSKWARYAMIMPISKKDLVSGKFIVLAIFSSAGSLFGLVTGSIGGLIMKNSSFSIAGMGELLFLALAAWIISLVFAVYQSRLYSNSAPKKGVCYYWYRFFFQPQFALGYISCLLHWVLH